MRYIVTGWILLTVAITLIIWAARPDMIKAAQAEITAPYREYKERKAEEIWKEARAQQHAQWVIKEPLPQKCSTARTALEELECKNLADNREKEFERVWRINLARGWRPEGIEN